MVWDIFMLILISIHLFPLLKLESLFSSALNKLLKACKKFDRI